MALSPQWLSLSLLNRSFCRVGATMTPEDWMESKFASEFYLRLVASLASASTANRGCLFPYNRSEEGTGHSSLPTEQAVDVLTR